MSLLVELDRGEGASVEQSAEGGTRVIRPAFVSGLTSVTESGMLLEAISANDGTNAIPGIGAAHPNDSALTVVSKTATPVPAQRSAEVRIVYQTAGSGGGISIGPTDPGDGSVTGGVIHIGAATTTRRTQLDKDGSPLAVTFSTWDKTPDKTQYGEVDIEVPQVLLRRVRRESAAPSDGKLAMVGHVNSGSLWGRAARTILFRRLDAVSTDGGETWEATYEFQVAEGNWDVLIPFRDPETGQPAEGITTLDGIATHRVYPESSFAGIGVSF